MEETNRATLPDAVLVVQVSLLIFHDVVPTMAHGSSPRTSHANKCTDLRICSFQFVEDSDTACSLGPLPLWPLPLCPHLPYLLLGLNCHENRDSNFLV